MKTKPKKKMGGKPKMKKSSGGKRKNVRSWQQ